LIKLVQLEKVIAIAKEKLLFSSKDSLIQELIFQQSERIVQIKDINFHKEVTIIGIIFYDKNNQCFINSI
jgi:hypothetical protein